MKRPRPSIDPSRLASSEGPLTTTDVAQLLRVHPKHVYRLLRGGLPGHRVGGEWRFWAAEVLNWAGSRRALPSPGSRPEQAFPRECPSLLAANGDIAVEQLLALPVSVQAPRVGMVQADRSTALEMLRLNHVLMAGCHGADVPAFLDKQRLAFVHLVRREVGFAVRRGMKLRTLRQLRGRRLASRPPTAGVRGHFDDQLRREGIDPTAAHASATLLSSHRDVVCAVARGDVDVGLASRAWVEKVGLTFVPMCTETYGLLVRADLLGDARVVQLCEIAQSAAYRGALSSVAGYDAGLTGTIRFDTPEPVTPAT